jgi:agmatine deiminase
MPERIEQLAIPPEWAPHKALWTAWPSHAELWQDDLAGARGEVAVMIGALCPGDKLKVLACGAEAVESAQAAVGHLAEIIPASFGDIWLRDTGPIFAPTAAGTVALRFRNNGWGGKYELRGDDTVGDAIAEAAGVEIIAFDAVLEGGALEHNGSGTILTTRQCLLNPNRNPGWTQARAEAFLQEAFNCRRVLWLENGLLNDHTDGHVDNLARFIAEDVVVCQAPSGADDPNAALYATIADELRAMNLTVHCIPSPGKFCNEDGDVMPASHMNFIIGNETVVVPTYDRKYGYAAVIALQDLFPDRKVVGVPSQYLLTGGGSFHCITQQEPITPESRP